MAVVNHEDQHGHYPAAHGPLAEGGPPVSWRVHILPCLSENQLFRGYQPSAAWDAAANEPLLGQMPRTFAFHEEHRDGLSITNYLVVVGPETAWPGSVGLRSRDVEDGLAGTVMIVENRSGVPWTEPRDLLFATMSFELSSPDGISSKYRDPAVVTLDGTVRRLRPGMSPDTLRAILTANGREEVRENGWEVLNDGRLREPERP